MTKKTADIKVRVDPLTKHTLEQMAERELLQLSDIVRRAIAQFVRTSMQSQADVQR